MNETDGSFSILSENKFISLNWFNFIWQWQIWWQKTTHFNVHHKIHQRFWKIWRKLAIIFFSINVKRDVCLYVYILGLLYFLLMFFSFSPTEILYISSRVLLYVFRFSFSFCVNNGSEKKRLRLKHTTSMYDINTILTYVDKQKWCS